MVGAEELGRGGYGHSGIIEVILLMIFWG